VAVHEADVCGFWFVGQNKSFVTFTAAAVGYRRAVEPLIAGQKKYRRDKMSACLPPKTPS
jgi:hypothetical protein